MIFAPLIDSLYYKRLLGNPIPPLPLPYRRCLWMLPYGFKRHYIIYRILHNIQIAIRQAEQTPKMAAFQVSTFLPCGKIAESGSFPTF